MAKDIEEIIAAHRAGHESAGTTWGIYFPPEAPWEVMESVMDQITELVFGLERENWDAFVFGQGGDCMLVPWSDDE